MLKRLTVMILCSVMFVLSPTYASEAPKMTAAEFEASLTYQKGDISLPGGIATLKIPESFRYLDPQDAERVLVQAWSNPSGKGPWACCSLQRSVRSRKTAGAS